MKITVVCAGKLKEKYLRDGVAEYEKRLRPYANLQIIEISEERMRDKPSSAEKEEIIRREGKRLIAQIPHGASLIVLDVQNCLQRNFPQRSTISLLQEKATLFSSSVGLLGCRMNCAAALISGLPFRSSHCRTN